MDLAVNILVALVAVVGALGATFLNNLYQSSREGKAEKRKARDVYLQNVNSFIVETAKLRAFLMDRDEDQIKELIASLPSLPSRVPHTDRTGYPNGKPCLCGLCGLGRAR